MYDDNNLNDLDREMELDALVECYRDAIEKEDNAPAILNMSRADQFQFALAVLTYIMRGKDVKVTCKTNEPVRTTGVIYAEGKTLEFGSVKWFLRIAEFADNIEVYPLEKDAVRMAFMFYDLATSMGGKI